MRKMSDRFHRYTFFNVAEFDEPMFTNNGVDIVWLDEKYVKETSLTAKQLVVTTPNGEQVFFPKTIKKQCKRKKWYNLLPYPMYVYELPITRKVKSDPDRWKM